MSDPIPPPETLGPGNWNKLLGNFLTLTAGEVLAGLMSVLALAAMARKLQPDQFGVISVGTTLVLWFSQLVDSGTEVLSMRDVARRPDRFKEIVEPILGLRLVLAVTAMAIMGPVILVLTRPSTSRVELLLFIMILPALSLNLRWMGLGVGAARPVAIGNALSQALFVAGVLLLVKGPHDGRWVPVLRTSEELFYALFVILAMTSRFGAVRPRIDLPLWRTTLMRSFPIMLSSLARSLIFTFDLVWIALVLPRHDAGFYGAASRPVMFCVGFVGLFSLSFISTYSSATEGHRPELIRKTVWISSITIPGALVVSVMARTLIGIVYGHAYYPAAPALSILVWVIPILALGAVFGGVLIAEGKQSVMLRNNLAGLALNISLNIFLVPAGGMRWAAAAGLAAQLLMAVLNYRSARTLGLVSPFKLNPASGSV